MLGHRSHKMRRIVCAIPFDSIVAGGPGTGCAKVSRFAGTNDASSGYDSRRVWPVRDVLENCFEHVGLCGSDKLGPKLLDPANPGAVQQRSNFDNDPPPDDRARDASHIHKFNVQAIAR